MATQAQCKAEWEAVKKATIEAIKKIDENTPFSEVEPDWWCEMIDALKALTP